MTSATTLIAALSLTILGGGAIHDFALTMSLGVFIGTFSSVFVSNPILLMLGDTRQYMVARKKVEYERPGEHGVVGVLGGAEGEVLPLPGTGQQCFGFTENPVSCFPG